jgi:hypothetical protein
MATQNDTTHVRAPKSARKRIAKLGKTLAKSGGEWKSPAVVSRALDALERELSAEQTKPEAT